MPIRTTKSDPYLFPRVRIELRRLRDQAGRSPSQVELSARSIRLEHSIQEICARYGETQANPMLISSTALEQVVTLPQNTWVEIRYKPEITDIQVGSQDLALASRLVSELNALKVREESRQEIPDLITNLSDPQIHVRTNAAKELAEIHAPEAFDPLVRALSDLSPRVRRAAVTALGRLLEESAVPKLIASLTDPDQQVRELAALELSKFNVPDVVNTMKDLFDLKGNSLRIRQGEAWVLASIMFKGVRAQELRNALLAGLEKGTEMIRSLAVINLGRLGHLMQILPALADPSPAVRESVILSLDSHDLYSFAKDLVNDRDPQIRDYMRFVLAEPRERSLNDLTQNRSLIEGGLFGLAIGDALGAPIEFMSAAEIKEQHGRVEQFIKNPRRPASGGETTDDTEMTLLTLNSIDTYTGNFLPLLYNKLLADHFYALDLGDKKDIGYGPNTLSVGRRLYAGVNWRLAGKKFPSCGAAMRISPISFFHIGAPNPGKLKEEVRAASIISHTHPRAVAGAEAIAFLLARLLDGARDLDLLQLIKETADFVRPTSGEFADRLLALPDLLAEPIESALEKIGTKSEAIESVLAAIYCFLKSPVDFKQTVANAVNVEGDSDSIGAMAGALSGAYNGIDRLPKELLDGLKNREAIEAALKRLLAPLNTISPVV
jgi:ADP-ribosylglycohydrolase